MLNVAWSCSVEFFTNFCDCRFLLIISPIIDQETLMVIHMELFTIIRYCEVAIPASDSPCQSCTTSYQLFIPSHTSILLCSGLRSYFVLKVIFVRMVGLNVYD